MRPAQGGGAWLALFAPRRQLTEFVLREPAYRQRMMAEIEPDHWVGPTHGADGELSGAAAGRHAEEAGGDQALGAVALLRSRACGSTRDWRPEASFHSRADGSRHGVTSALEWRGRLYAASRGADAVLAVDLDAGE